MLQLVEPGSWVLEMLINEPLPLSLAAVLPFTFGDVLWALAHSSVANENTINPSHRAELLVWKDTPGLPCLFFVFFWSELSAAERERESAVKKSLCRAINSLVC